MEKKHVDEWWDEDWQTIAKRLLNVDHPEAPNAVHFQNFAQARVGEEMQRTANATLFLGRVTVVLALATVALAFAAFLSL